MEDRLPTRRRHAIWGTLLLIGTLVLGADTITAPTPVVTVAAAAACDAAGDPGLALLYGISAAGGRYTLSVTIGPAGQPIFTLAPSDKGAGSMPAYSGTMTATAQTSRTIRLRLSGAATMTVHGRTGRTTALMLAVTIDLSRGNVTGTMRVAHAHTDIRGAVADAGALRALSCALDAIRARAWNVLYAATVPAYRERYTVDEIAATVSPTGTVATVSIPPWYERARETRGAMAGFWGGDDLVAAFVAMQVGAESRTVALYAVHQGGAWRPLIAPPLACTLQTQRSGPFACAISLALSDRLGSYAYLVDGYGAGDGGLIPGQFAVIGSTMPWQLGPGDHTIELQSGTGGWNSEVFATAVITIPGAPPTPSTVCASPTTAPAPAAPSGLRLHVSGGFPGQAVWVTFDTKALTGTWDAFEIDLDGAPNGNGSGAVFSPVGVQLPPGAAPGWHSVSIYRLTRPSPNSPPLNRFLYATTPFLVYAPGSCRLPADSTSGTMS